MLILGWISWGRKGNGNCFVFVDIFVIVGDLFVFFGNAVDGGFGGFFWMDFMGEGSGRFRQPWRSFRRGKKEEEEEQFFFFFFFQKILSG
jgi:hypothetical protein